MLEKHSSLLFEDCRNCYYRVGEWDSKGVVSMFTAKQGISEGGACRIGYSSRTSSAFRPINSNHKTIASRREQGNFERNNSTKIKDTKWGEVHQISGAISFIGVLNGLINSVQGDVVLKHFLASKCIRTEKRHYRLQVILFRCPYTISNTRRGGIFCKNKYAYIIT